MELAMADNSAMATFSSPLYPPTRPTYFDSSGTRQVTNPNLKEHSYHTLDSSYFVSILPPEICRLRKARRKFPSAKSHVISLALLIQVTTTSFHTTNLPEILSDPAQITFFNSTQS